MTFSRERSGWCIGVASVAKSGIGVMSGGPCGADAKAVGLEFAFRDGSRRNVGCSESRDSGGNGDPDEVVLEMEIVTAGSLHSLALDAIGAVCRGADSTGQTRVRGPAGVADSEP